MKEFVALTLPAPGPRDWMAQNPGIEPKMTGENKKTPPKTNQQILRPRNYALLYFLKDIKQGWACPISEVVIRAQSSEPT